MTCTTIQNRNLEQIYEALEQCEMAEIRLDRCDLTSREIDELFTSDVPLVATCRIEEVAATDPTLQEVELSEQSRGIKAMQIAEKRLIRAIEAGAAGIDMQGYTFHLPSKNEFCGEDKYSFTKGNPKEIITDEEIIAKQCEFIEKVHTMGAEVLLSCHPGITMTAEQVVDLAHFLEKRNPDIIKIVTKAENEEDLAESIRAMLLLKKEIKTPVAYHANGKAGMLSRIINPLLGGQIAFCVDRYTEASVMEQINLKCANTIVENVMKIL